MTTTNTEDIQSDRRFDQQSNDQRFAHSMVNRMRMDNTMCELEEFSSFLSMMLYEKRQTIGIPIGDKINSCEMFEFLIKTLHKFDPGGRRSN